MTLTEEELFSRPFDAKEAGEYLRLSEKTVFKLLRKGVLPAVKIGRKWRVSRKALEEYVATGGRMPKTSEAGGKPLDFLSCPVKNCEPAVRDNPAGPDQNARRCNLGSAKEKH